MDVGLLFRFGASKILHVMKNELFWTISECKYNKYYGNIAYYVHWCLVLMRHWYTIGIISALVLYVRFRNYLIAVIGSDNSLMNYI